MVGPGAGVVTRVDRRETLAVAVQDQPGERIAGRCTGLEIDEMSGRVGRSPPVDERLARPECEVAPLACLEEQVVEAVERSEGGSAGASKPSPGSSSPARVS